MSEHPHPEQGQATEQKRPVTEQDKQERKERLQTQGRASVTQSIADAVVVKEGEVFFLSEPDGDVPLGGEHGFGLYYHDCRFLNGYELRLADAKPEVLVATAHRGFMAVIELTNPDIRMSDGKLLRKEELGIKWERMIDSSRLAFYDALTFQDYGLEPIAFPIALTFQAEFEPLFAVRGLLREELGTLHPPRWHDSGLSLRYDGADAIERSLSIQFSPAPQSTGATTARFHIALQPEENKQILVSFYLGETQDTSVGEPKTQAQPDFKDTQTRLQDTSYRCLAQETEIHSNSILLNRLMDRSLRDLHLLQTTSGGQKFFAAGVPWFVTLFGRDSLIAALQTLAYDPDIAVQTLRILANYQGQKLDPWRDEEPGKIMHELRIGEMAHLNEIPQTPYYGTIDATPLFLILIARHAAWTGDLTVFNELRGNIERTLAWMAESVDQNRDGYIEYQSSSKKGLINQGWKDSGDAIVNADGSLARPPISLVEVQGYVYSAKVSLADLYERTGERDRAEQLRSEADELRARFNRDFWLEDKAFYALALQADHKPAAVISSNPGQALWSGIVDPEKAHRTVQRLMVPDMFNGWGIRTLSEQERRYNPIGYHLGTVWPHDNSLIASGFRRYGFDKEACEIFTAIAEAAMYFEHYRLPEVFAGFCREDYGVPVHYPVACHPQAWAAGAIPYLVETLLGLVPEAFDERLRIVRPVLPGFVDRLELRRLRVGSSRADLRFERTSQGGVSVEVLQVTGSLDVVVEDGSS